MSNKKAVSDYRKRVRAYALEAFNTQCGICGYNKCSNALEFHHINPSEKEFGLSAKGMTRSWDKMVMELKKCICICSNCHREVHSGITDIPSNIITFDEKYEVWPSVKKVKKLKDVNNDIKVEKVCPVCASKVPNRQKHCSTICANKSREKAIYPSDDELLNLVNNFGYSHVSRLFNVSDNSIRKRLKTRGLLPLVNLINK